MESLGDGEKGKLVELHAGQHLLLGFGVWGLGFGVWGLGFRV